jgi:hypothetical protein
VQNSLSSKTILERYYYVRKINCPLADLEKSIVGKHGISSGQKTLLKYKALITLNSLLEKQEEDNLIRMIRRDISMQTLSKVIS